MKSIHTDVRYERIRSGSCKDNQMETINTDDASLQKCEEIATSMGLWGLGGEPPGEANFDGWERNRKDLKNTEKALETLSSFSKSSII